VSAELRFELAPELVAPSIARDRFDQWLQALDWPSAQREDLVLALSEAVGNSVEHGYQIDTSNPPTKTLATGIVQVRARLLLETSTTRRIRLVVRDYGRWRAPAASARFRGHGLNVIRACTDHLDINGSDAGTTLTILSRPTPSLP
jgi:anti-sigma regulatory factor (Ser/Thr protein kinase)